MESNFISTMLLVMLSVNVFLGMVDFGMRSLDSDISYFNFATTPAGNMTNEGEINGTFRADYDDATIDVADAVSTNTGTVFTDSMKSINSWWNKMNTKFGIASSILRQPAGFMKDMGFPSIIYISFGAIWYSLGLIALIYLMTGRN